MDRAIVAALTKGFPAGVQSSCSTKTTDAIDTPS